MKEIEFLRMMVFQIDSTSWCTVTASQQSVDSRLKIWQRHVGEGIMRDFSVMCLDQFQWHYSNIKTNKVKHSSEEYEAIRNETDDFIPSNKKIIRKRTNLTKTFITAKIRCGHEPEIIGNADHDDGKKKKSYTMITVVVIIL